MPCANDAFHSAYSVCRLPHRGASQGYREGQARHQELWCSPSSCPCSEPWHLGANRLPMVHHACPKVPGLGPGLPCVACALLCTGHGCIVQMPELCRNAWHCHADGSTKPCLRRDPTAQRLSSCRMWGAAQTAACHTAWRTWRRRPALRARCRASAIPASVHRVLADAYVHGLHDRTPDSVICANAFQEVFLARHLCLCL